MTSKQYLLRLKTVFLSFFIASISIGAIAYFMLQPFNGQGDGQSFYFMMGFAAAIFCLLLFILMNKQKNHEASEHRILSDKLMAFQNNYLTTLSLLIGPIILNYILYGIGGPIFNFYIGLFMTGLLAARFPRIQMVSNSLNLKEVDENKLKNESYKII